MDEDAPLPVQLRLLSVVVRPVKELSSRRVHRRQERQTLLDGFPLRQGEDADAFPGQARDVELRPVLLFKVAPERCRHFEPPLAVHPRRVISSQHRGCGETRGGRLLKS
jgi:hypothetical protein